jgi:PAP2 superfamily
MTAADPTFQKNGLGDEWRFAALNLSAVSLFTLHVLLQDALTVAAYLRLAGAFVAITLLIVASGLICFAGQAVVRAGLESRWKASPTGAIRLAFLQRWRQDRLLSLAWPTAVFMLLMPSFTAFKQRILPGAGFVHDEALASIDRMMFGTDPGLWLHQAIGSPGATAFFDGIYHSWFVPTTLGVCVVGLCAGVRTRAQYMIAYLGVWVVLGAGAAYLLPAAGPAFYEALVSPVGAAPFNAVRDSLIATGSGGHMLTSLHNQAYLIENLNSPTLVIGGGISAIPSVHNAIAVLFALASFAAHRALGWLMSGFALLIWIGSVYLNWHYAIDGVIGAAGAVGLWYGAGYLVDRMLTSSGKARGEVETNPVPAVSAPAA